MAQKHIVRSYDQELEALKTKILTMGSEAENQLTLAVEALVQQNDILAKNIVKSDTRVNQLQEEIDALTVLLLAKRQPMALDLRIIISALKIATDLERIADYAANFAQHIIQLNHIKLEKPVASIRDMADRCLQMLKEVIHAYDELDENLAVQVWHRDDQVDAIYIDLLNILRRLMSEDSDNVKSCTTLLFVARCCERIGDHITNIAENIFYIVRGDYYRGP